MQWWILGETNEAVASGPFFGAPFDFRGPLKNSTYNFNSLQMFFKGVDEVGTKSGKYRDRF